MSEETLSEQVMRAESSNDVGHDAQQPSGLPISYSLSHLTLSEKAMAFFESDPLLSPLIPLADQIMATNYLSEQRMAEYKMRVTDAVTTIMIDMDEDTEEGHKKLETAEIYLRQIIDGCKKGYRGKLATESKRVYRSETDEQPQKRGWLPW